MNEQARVTENVTKTQKAPDKVRRILKYLT